MKLIRSSYEIIPQEAGLEGIYKAIERAGRTCYKSEDKITHTSAKDFVDRMIKSGHHAMLEFGTVYLKCKCGYNSPLSKYKSNKYSKYTNDVAYIDETPSDTSITYNHYVVTNYRVLVENNWLDDLKYLCEPTENHEKRVCVRFTTDRGVSHELVRHRVFSFAQESTRYCNYSKEKFGNELTYILPSWSGATEGDYGTIANPKEIQFHEYDKNSTFEIEFINAMLNLEDRYMNIIDTGFTPQQARQILPNALKTEVVMTGFISDWRHFFELRDNSHAHPDMQVLVAHLHKEFKDRNYV